MGDSLYRFAVFLLAFLLAFFLKKLFLKELERSLLGLVSLLVESLDTAETNGMLLAADNAPLLCLH